MAKVELAEAVLRDFERFLDHLAAHEIASTADRIEQILEALQLLRHSPMLGRSARGGLRELVVRRPPRCYVALYRYVAPIDTAFVLAIRHQREAA